MGGADPTRASELTVRLLARCRFPAPGTPVNCAVSGGPDSLALLVLAVASGCRVTAVHVDHGLRAGSAAEADVVEAAAIRLGAGFLSLRAEVDPGPNLEARARAARYGVLPPGALVGHTADDQAETVLINLLRGAALEGLAGMRADDRRPILGLRRSETEELCAAHGLEPVRDPSNADPAILRNRVRAELVPLLADLSDRDPVPLLVRQAALLREVADHVAGEAEALDPTDAAALAAAPAVLARAALRRWLRPCTTERHPPSAAAVERVLGVARGEVRATEVAGGWRVARSRGRLRLEPPHRLAADGVGGAR